MGTTGITAADSAAATVPATATTTTTFTAITRATVFAPATAIATAIAATIRTQSLVQYEGYTVHENGNKTTRAIKRDSGLCVERQNCTVCVHQ